MAKRTRLTRKERMTISTLLNSGKAMKDIAAVLDRSFSTISLEIKRGGGKRGYRPVLAHSRAQSRHCRNLRMILDEERHIIRSMLDNGDSKLAICARLNIGRAALYRELKAGGWPGEYMVSISKAADKRNAIARLQRSWKRKLGEFFFGKGTTQKSQTCCG